MLPNNYTMPADSLCLLTINIHIHTALIRRDLLLPWSSVKTAPAHVTGSNSSPPLQAKLSGSGDVTIQSKYSQHHLSTDHITALLIAREIVIKNSAPHCPVSPGDEIEHSEVVLDIVPTGHCAERMHTNIYCYSFPSGTFDTLIRSVA